MRADQGPRARRHADEAAWPVLAERRRPFEFEHGAQRLENMAERVFLGVDQKQRPERAQQQIGVADLGAQRFVVELQSDKSFVQGFEFVRHGPPAPQVPKATAEIIRLPCALRSQMQPCSPKVKQPKNGRCRKLSATSRATSRI